MGTKIKIVKPIKISEIGNMVLPIDHVCEVSDSAAKVFIKKGYATESKVSAKDAKDIDVKDVKEETGKDVKSDKK